MTGTAGREERTMSKLHAVLMSLAALFLLSRPPDAEARRLGVFYDTAGEPVGFNRSGMLGEIQEAMREWEYNGGGKIVLEWRGVTTGRAGGGGDNLIVGWDPTLVGTRTCAMTWTYAAFQAPPMGRINLNPSMWNRGMLFTNTPVVGAGCRVMRATLIHHMTHWFRWDISHRTDSALSSPCDGGTGACSDHLMLHVWNSDMGGINQNTYFPLFAPTYPPQPLLLLTEIYNATTGGVTAGGGIDIGPQNFTASLGVGGPGFDYAQAFSTVVTARGNTVVVQQGNGRVPWATQRVIGETAVRQTCVTGVPGSADMYVAWPAPQQRSIASTVGTLLFPNAGERAVRFSESHDGGNTWTAPADVPGAFTRTGVSCGFDAARGRVVLAFAESVGFTVRFTDRVPGALGPGGWTAPMAVGSGILPFVMTYETPLLAFDPFTAGSGMLSWTGSTQRAPLRARLLHDGTRYNISALGFATTVAEQNALRSHVVPNPFGLGMHFALGLNTPLPAQVRLRRMGAVTLATETNPATTAPYVRYLGAGNSRGFVESAYIEQMIPRP
jgi:hypothetical protein